MDEKMTSGEIAKKAGVSQKAIRLYDEKGLLKPTDYSEGNYRLYDKEALVILEKIVALKQIGFSLEEIRNNLTAGDAKDIEEALRMQLAVMEEKRYRIEMVIDAINRTLARNEKDLDWDDVANIVQSVTVDQNDDRNHWLYLKHTLPGKDWYVNIFRSMDFEKDQKVLDLGCGYSKIWRNNKEDIPEGMKIAAYDIRGSWADDFEKWIEENGKDLPGGVKIDLNFMDLEKDEAWNKIEEGKTYDRIIAHYVFDEVKDFEAVVAKASKVLSKDGFFSVNGPDLTDWTVFFRNSMNEAGIDAPFIDELAKEQEAERDAFKAMLGKYYSRIETVNLENHFRYDDAEDLVEKMKDIFPAQTAFFGKNQDKIRQYFEGKISETGEFIFKSGGRFLHCYI